MLNESFGTYSRTRGLDPVVSANSSQVNLSTATPTIDNLAAQVLQLREEVGLGGPRQNYGMISGGGGGSQAARPRQYTTNTPPVGSPAQSPNTSGILPQHPHYAQLGGGVGSLTGSAAEERLMRLCDGVQSLMGSLQARHAEYDEGMRRITTDLGSILRRLDNIEHKQDQLENTATRIQGKLEEQQERLTAEERLSEMLLVGHQNSSRSEAVTTGKLVEAFELLEVASTRAAKMEKRVGVLETSTQDISRGLESAVQSNDTLRSRLSQAEDRASSGITDCTRLLGELRNGFEDSLAQTTKEMDRRFLVVEGSMGENTDRTRSWMTNIEGTIEATSKNIESKVLSALKQHTQGLQSHSQRATEKVEEITNHKISQLAAEIAACRQTMDTITVNSKSNAAETQNLMQKLELDVQSLNRRLVHCLRVMCEEPTGYPTPVKTSTHFNSGRKMTPPRSHTAVDLHDAPRSNNDLFLQEIEKITKFR